MLYAVYILPCPRSIRDFIRKRIEHLLGNKRKSFKFDFLMSYVTDFSFQVDTLVIPCFMHFSIRKQIICEEFAKFYYEHVRNSLLMQWNVIIAETKRASLDAFLKASGILKCALNLVMTEMSEDLM